MTENEVKPMQESEHTLDLKVRELRTAANELAHTATTLDRMQQILVDVVYTTRALHSSLGVMMKLLQEKKAPKKKVARRKHR